MESRIARLESDVGHIKADIADLKENTRNVGRDVAALKTDLEVIKSNYATREFIETRFKEQRKQLVVIVFAIAGILGPLISWFLQHYKP